jgi:hypothetical protein
MSRNLPASKKALRAKPVLYSGDASDFNWVRLSQ